MRPQPAKCRHGFRTNDSSVELAFEQESHFGMIRRRNLRCHPISQSTRHQEIAHDWQPRPFVRGKDIEITHEGKLALADSACEAIVAVVPAALHEGLHELLEIGRIEPCFILAFAPGERAAPEIEPLADCGYHVRPAIGKKCCLVNVIYNVCRRYIIQPATKIMRRDHFNLRSSYISTEIKIILLYLKYIIYQ